MKGTKFLLAFWLSTATFCLLQIVFGPGGITEMARLNEQNSRLEARLTALREDNARLTARYEALRTSSTAIQLEARSLGYFKSGETPVRTLDGAEFRLPSDEPDLSTVPPLADSSASTSLFFRLALPLLFFVYYGCFHLASRLWPARSISTALVPREPNRLAVVLNTGVDFFRK